MSSVICTNPQTSVVCMLIKCLVTKESHNHNKNSIYARTHALDIHANLTNLHITTWKGTFIPFLNHCSPDGYSLIRVHQLEMKNKQIFT